MPLYTFHHVCSLSHVQKSDLATQVTVLHCQTFTTPSAFVNVVFRKYDSNGLDETVFVGGKAASPNYLIAHLRPRNPHNQSLLDDLTRSLLHTWERIAVPAATQQGINHSLTSSSSSSVQASLPQSALSSPRALHSVFLLPSIGAGAEQGFVLPVAGDDAGWAERWRGEIEARAEQGEEAMGVLVEEMKTGFGGSSKL